MASRSTQLPISWMSPDSSAIQKFGGRRHPAVGKPPSYQRLDDVDLHGFEADLRLVHQFELRAFDRAAQVLVRS
jgi:hypothetical protein